MNINKMLKTVELLTSVRDTDVVNLQFNISLHADKVAIKNSGNYHARIYPDTIILESDNNSILLSRVIEFVLKDYILDVNIVSKKFERSLESAKVASKLAYENKLAIYLYPEEIIIKAPAEEDCCLSCTTVIEAQYYDTYEEYVDEVIKLFSFN